MSRSYLYRTGISSRAAGGEMDEEVELKDLKEAVGLSSTDALRILQMTVKEELKHYNRSHKFQFVYDVIDTFYNVKNTPVDWFGICLIYVEAALLFAGYHLGDENTGVIPVIEGIIVLLCGLLVTFTCLREYYLQRTEVARSFMNVFNNNQDDLHGDAYLDIGCPPSASITSVATYRDNLLVNLPWNLLVEGDIIKLGPSELAPTHIKQVIDADTCNTVPFCLDAGEIFNPPRATARAFIEENTDAIYCTPYPPQKFMVMETPIRRCIRSTFQHCYQRPKSVLNHNLRKISVIIRKKVFWFFLIMSLFVNFVRYRLEPTTVGHYSEVMLLATAYVILPITPILFPVLWILVSLFGAACIRTSFKRSKKDDVHGSRGVWKVGNANYKLISKDFCRLLYDGDPSALPRTANLLHTLGSVTTFCCVDKSGVLSYPNLTPAKVFMFKSMLPDEEGNDVMKHGQNHRESCDTEDMKKSLDIPDDEAFLNSKKDQCDTEVLNLSYDSKSINGIQFDDETWKNYMKSLKPLGLNLMLNSPCPFPLRRQIEENLTGHISLAANCSPVPNLRRCSCPLVREIGFNEFASHAFLKFGHIFSYRPVHASELSIIPSDYFLSIVKDKLVPSMVSIVVRENQSGMMQLLTQGSADIVLDACTDFWDGDDLCELSSNDRRKVLDFYQRMSTTGHCIALSYRPIVERTHAQWEDDIFIECPNALVFPSLENDFGSTWSLPPKICNPEEKLESPDQELAKIYEEYIEDTVADTKSPTDAIRLLGKQIFLGMVTYSDLVKEDTACLVENLNNGGIRFVYFSSENELKSKVFAERLGLETGWNCHISLANSNSLYCRDNQGISETLPSDDEYLLPSSKSNVAEVEPLAGQYSESNKRNTGYCSGSEDLEKERLLYMKNDHEDFYLISNRAKLPRGIRNIRPHLKNVDDVPLLVPLFTDCTPQAVTEMIEIMQENGEVVCCFGSSINIWNSHIFSQADVSFAIDPLHPQICVRNKSRDYRSGAPVTSNYDLHPSTNSALNDVTSLQLSSMLNSVPCSLLCRQEQQIDFLSLICEARRLMLNMRSCFLFMLSAYLTLSISMLLSFCFLLPFPFTGINLLWLKLIIVPIISLSLLGSSADDQLMNQIMDKRITNIYDDARHYMKHFFPTFGLNAAYITIGLFAGSLFSFCLESHGAKGDCHFLYGSKNLSEPWHGWITVNREGLYMIQSINLFFTTLYFVFLSVAFVHRTHHIWKKLPFSNKIWCKAVLICLILQSLYTAVSLYLSNVPGIKHDFYPGYIKYPLIMAVLWPIALLIVNEIMKRKYIKDFIRNQKRERLKFDTKLGMNSPV